MSAGLDNSYLAFSYMSVPDSLHDLKVEMSGLSPIDADFKYMWNYGFSGRPAKTCYLKVKIKVNVKNDHKRQTSLVR